jgi:hypothetical protein
VVEQAVAIGVEGAGHARLLHARGDRDYNAVGANEFAGTADMFASRSAWVGELKTGAVWVEPMPSNLQIGLFGLALWYLSGELPSATLVQAGRPLRVQRWQYTVSDLNHMQGELRRIADQIQQWRVDLELLTQDALVMGDHCARCPSLFQCPALDVVVGDNPGERYAQAEAIIAREKKRRSIVEDLARGGPVALPGQRELFWQRRERRVFRAEAATDYLRHKYGSEAVRACSATSVTAGAVDEWAEQQPSLGPSKAARRRALANELTQAGALQYQPYDVRATRKRENQ